MKRIGCLLALMMLAGCSAPVDLSQEYWDGKAAIVGEDGQRWPDWDKARHQGVLIGDDHSLPQREWASFCWNETGLFGSAVGDDFLPITISQADATRPPIRITIVDPKAATNTAPEFRKPFRQLTAHSSLDGKITPLPAAQFRYHDSGQVLKSGQCLAVFWVSWEALGSNDPTAIRIQTGGKTLIFNPTTKAK